MTESHDELIGRLSAADPIDPEALPTADDPAAHQLLESIVTTPVPAATDPATDPLTDPLADPATDPGSRPLLDLPEVEGIDRYARRAPRPRGWMVGAAAAVIALLAGLLVLSPDGSSPALAALHDAAATTADFDSGRVTTAFDLERSDGTTTETLVGEVRADFSGSDIAVTLDVTEATRLGAMLGSVTPEVRLVDGVVYANDGTGWFSIDDAGPLGQRVVDFVDPRSVLTAVQELLETTEIGPVTIDGVDTTHYQSIVDLGDETLGEAGWLAVETARIHADGTITVDLYVDGSGVLRRLDVNGDVREADGGTATASFSATTTFSDLGADLAIEAPADARPFDGHPGFGPGNESEPGA